MIPILVIGATTGSLFASFMPIRSQPSPCLVPSDAQWINQAPACLLCARTELYGFGNPTALFLVCSISFIFSGRLGIYERQIIPEGLDADWEV